MTDRVPIYVLPNGAVRQDIYDGQGNFLRSEYVLKNDGAVVKGTPLNKVTLESVGLNPNDDPTPNDAFGMIGKAIRKNLINILHLKLQQSLAAADIDAWSDLFDDTVGINASVSSLYAVSGGQLKKYAPTAASKTGSTATSNTNSGSYIWSTPSYSLIPDGSCSTASPAAGNSGLTHRLEVKGFGFSVPALAQILGITATIRRKADHNNLSNNWYVKDNSVRLIGADGNYKGSDKAVTSLFWPTSLTNAVYGGSTDLWGAAWSAADINSPSFGLSINCSIQTPPSVPNWASVDGITIAVAYNYSPSSAVIVWSPVSSTEALQRMSIAAAQYKGTGDIRWYLSDDGVSWIQASPDTMTAVGFDATSVYLKCEITTVDAYVNGVAWGGF